jgi:tetratricopeptide (TPR) repeat protein
MATMQIDIQTLHDVVRREGALHVFGAVYEELVSDSAAYDAASDEGTLTAFLTQLVRRSCRKNPDAQVMPQVFTDPTGAEIQAGSHQFSTGDPDAALLAPRVLEEARREASDKMDTYLGWLEHSHAGVSDGELAVAAGIEAVTIRGGRKRAVDFLLEVAHRMRHPALRIDAELPEPLARIAALLGDGDTDHAARLLEQARSDFDADPRWWNLMGVRAWRDSEWDAAIDCYREALVLADEPRLRTKILNNWGTIELSKDRYEAAQALFLRATRITQDGVPLWLNLLSVASLRHDVHDCRFYATRLVKVLRRKERSDAERRYASQRLRENPNYAWVRKTSAWQTIARWLRSSQARPAILPGVGRAVAAATMVLMCATLFACGHADQAADVVSVEQELSRVDETSEDPDGDVWVRPKAPESLDLPWLVRGHEAQQSDWSGADLSGVDLVGADLSGTVLWGANLTGANLVGADFRDADLSDVDWGNTTCPDGSNSDGNGGTCLGHLDPGNLVIIGG